MNGFVKVKDGVRFQVIAPAGFRLLSAIEGTARRLGVDLTITCACEAHPPLDPHSLGEAYDVRTHDLNDSEKRRVLRELMLELSEPDDQYGAPIAVSSGLATAHFFGWIEHLNEPNEHIHLQRRHGTVYGLKA